MSLNKTKADKIADHLLKNDEKVIEELERRGFQREEGLGKYAKQRKTITVAEFLIRLGFDIKMEDDNILGTDETWYDKYLNKFILHP